MEGSALDAATAVPTDAAPGSHDAFARAGALRDAGDHAGAEALLRDAISRDPDSAKLRHARGVVLAAMNRHVDAVECYRDALACDPAAIGSWTNLGNALTQLNHLHTAIACHQRAIALSGGDDPRLHLNLGNSLAASGRHEEAIGAFTRALELDPACHMARWDRALAHLYLGDYREGFADYESRKLTGLIPVRDLPGRVWDGRPYPGQRLVVVAEQGFGDMLWAARYFRRVKALGGELVIECRRELLALIDGMGIADRLVAPGELPPAELHCHLCSLPGLFTVDFASIPSAPYLAAPRERMAKFAPLFERAGSRLKVGIVWSGSVTYARNHRRAQKLQSFLQAFALPGVALYSLQKGPAQAELAEQSNAIIDLSPYLDDFADTAAAVAHLDLVIMTDSAVAHLTGGLGKPVWLLLGHPAYWLWLRDRTDSPWYPSARLFRPRTEADWDHVFDLASAELMRLARF
jgi:Tfp pilus assembly protein PilF